jgi:type I restriction enzyme S subunit
MVEFFSGFAWKSSAFSDDTSGTPIIRIQNVDSARVSDFVYWTDHYDERFIVKPGDILLTLSGSFRVVVWDGPRSLLNQRIVKLTPAPFVDRSWLVHAIRRVVGDIEAMGRHALVNNVALSDLRQMPFVCPPLSEQRRIATILDQADELRRKRQHALDLLETLPHLIFIEMFGDPITNSKCLPIGSLGDLIKVRSGDALIGANQNGGVYPVFGGNGVNGWHDQYLVPADTIIIGRVGVYCGAVHVTDRNSWVTDNALIVEKRSEALSSAYLAAALKIANLNQYAGRSAQPLVSGSRIYPVTILLPAFDEQCLFASRLAQIRQLESLHHDNLKKLNALFASLQHRAFSGDLTARQAERELELAG